MSEHEDHPPGEDDTGAGYPEQSQPGTGIEADEHSEDDVTPQHDAPKTDTARDGGPGQATGNPRAAGG
jgi:hypothetical protein